MEHIQTLSTARGRALLRDVFRELRYEKQVSGFTALLTCWRLCTFDREIYRYSKFQVTVLHALGVFAGTSLWMREIINRFYFPVMNSLVYLGAAMLLLVIAAYRFTDVVDSRIAIASVGFEAFLLVLLFVVMFFSPADDIEMEQAPEDEKPSEIQELIGEVGEISSDYAAMADKLDNIADALTGLIGRQDELINSIKELTGLTALAVSPQPAFVSTITETNRALQQFNASVQSFTASAASLHREEIERAVRIEVESILANRMDINRQR